MAIAYIPPGVTVQEFSSPSVAPLLAVSASICLVGLSAGAVTRTDAIQLNGTTPVTLPSVPAGSTMSLTAVIQVMDAVNPQTAPGGYVATTDYTFSNTAFTITRVGGGAIPDGASVYVSYTYTPADYFAPIRLDNMSDIVDRFGPAWNSTGTSISSPLSHAAQIAFENGAQNVVLQPLFYNNAGTKQQPTATQNSLSATWTDNFVQLRDLEDINIIVPVVGQSQANVGDANQLAIVQTLQDHIKFMADNQQYIVGIFGEDSSASNTVAQLATLLTHATTIAARYGGQVTQQLVMVSPSKYTRNQPGAPGTINIGGQYVAAGVAGMLAARPVSKALTRKPISGFNSITDPRTKAQRLTDAGTGMFVFEQKGQLVQVRHALTMDTTAAPKRELSVVRAKHRMIESVRDTIETQIIGEVVADGNAPLIVASAITAVLEALKLVGDLVNYSGVQARTLSLDPTTIEVRFSYKPSFPINYVNIIFSLDLTNQTVTLPDTTQAAGASI